MHKLIFFFLLNKNQNCIINLYIKWLVIITINSLLNSQSSIEHSTMLQLLQL